MVISILKNNQGIRLVLDFTKKNDFIIREKLKIKIEIEEEWEALKKIISAPLTSEFCQTFSSVSLLQKLNGKNAGKHQLVSLLNSSQLACILYLQLLIYVCMKLVYT